MQRNFGTVIIEVLESNDSVMSANHRLSECNDLIALVSAMMPGNIVRGRNDAEHGRNDEALKQNSLIVQ